MSNLHFLNSIMGIISRQGIKATLVTFFGIALGAFTTLYLLPKFLTPSEVGLLNTVQKTGGLLSPLLAFGAHTIIQRYYPLKTAKDKLISTCLKLLFLSISVVSVIYIFWKDEILNLFKANSPEMLDYSIYPLAIGILIALYTFFEAIAAAVSRIAVPTFLKNTLSKLFKILSVLGFVYLGWTLSGLVFWYFIGAFLLPLVFLLWYVFKTLRIPISNSSTIQFIEGLKEYGNFYLFSVLSNFTGILVFSIDAVMISSVDGLEASGVYTIALYMVTVIQIPKKMIKGIGTSHLSSLIQSENKQPISSFYSNMGNNLYFIGLLTFGLIWLGLPSLYQIMPNGHLYAGGTAVVGILGVASLAESITSLNREIIQVSSLYRYNLYFGIATAILSIFMNLWLIPKFGIVGAALATLGTTGLVNILATALVYIKIGIHPFSIKTAYFLPLSILLLVLFHALSQSLSLSPLIHIVVISSLWLAVIIPLGYILKISETLNNLVTKYLKT